MELDAQGHLITMTPASSETSGRNSRLVMRLLLWADQQGGWKVFESSGCFRLPDGSVLSPEQRRGFAALCPDLVVELASPGAWSRPPHSRPARSFPGCS
jgi:Uma2 family endonuclease